MLQYLIIILDDTSTSFCHYNSCKKECNLINKEVLKEGIIFGMKENLTIQFVYPNYEIPEEYKEIINSIDHSKIIPSIANTEEADVVVFNNWDEIKDYPTRDDKAYILRISRDELFANHSLLSETFKKFARLNIVITDIEEFSEADFDKYAKCLNDWNDEVQSLYKAKHPIQINVLTDRIMLNEMNNCGAGDASITLAPDGKFYECPAFYLDAQCDGTEKSLGDICSKGHSVGSLAKGLDIRNPQLYKLSHAPICRKCDAYQCKRCIWLNRKTTCEINTPSHEQCVVAHIERNASRNLQKSLIEDKLYPEENKIKELSYLDPFDMYNNL